MSARRSLQAAQDTAQRMAEAASDASVRVARGQLSKLEFQMSQL